MSDDFDMVIDFAQARKDSRPCPPGRFLAEVIDETNTTSPRKGTPGIEITLALRSALDGQDLEGIPLEKIRVRHTFWLSPAAAGVLAREMQAFFPEYKDSKEKMSLRDLRGHLIGRPVIVDLVSKARRADGTPYRYPRLNVTRFESAA